MSRLLSVPDPVKGLLAAPSGVISRSQAHDCGLGDASIHALLRDERWTRINHGIFLRGVSEPTFEQLLWAGHLLAGEPSAIGGRAALFHAGVGRQPDDIVVFVPPWPWRMMPWPYTAVRDGRGRLDHARGTLPLIGSRMRCSTSGAPRRSRRSSAT